MHTLHSNTLTHVYIVITHHTRNTLGSALAYDRGMHAVVAKTTFIETTE